MNIDYSLSSAANILQVKRSVLLTIEKHIPELQTCLLRPNANHYNSYDFALIRSIVQKVFIHKMTLEEAINSYLKKQHGTSIKLDTEIIDVNDIKEVKKDLPKPIIENNSKAEDYEDNIAEEHANIEEHSYSPIENKILEKEISKEEEIVTPPVQISSASSYQDEEDTTEESDNPGDWYYNKLFSQAQGQKNLNFDSPAKIDPEPKSIITNIESAESIGSVGSVEKPLSEAREQKRIEENTKYKKEHVIEDKEIPNHITENIPLVQEVKNSSVKNQIEEGASLLDKLNILENLLSKEKPETKSKTENK